jgi:hypothetical protein
MMSPGDNTKKVIIDLAKKQLTAEANVARLKDELALAETELNTVRLYQLPEALDLVGSEVFKYRDPETGQTLHVEAKETIRASIDKEGDVERAYSWLEETGVSGAVKNEVIAQLDSGDMDGARKLTIELTSRGISVSTKRTIAPPTLDKIIRDQLSEGLNVPTEAFKIFRQRATKVKLD